MSWYKKAQEDDQEDLKAAMGDFYTDEIVNKTEELRKLIRDAIIVRIGAEGTGMKPGKEVRGPWFMAHVEPYLVARINSDLSILHSPDKIQGLIDWVTGCALIGRKAGWLWMDQCLVEMDSELVKALISLIEDEWITDEQTFENALAQYNYVMEDSNSKPGDAKNIAHELRLRLQALENKAEDQIVKRFYIKPIEKSTRYDNLRYWCSDGPQQGAITPKPLDFTTLLFGTANKKWELDEDSRQILTFMARPSVAKSIDSKLPSCLTVLPYMEAT